MKNSMSYKIYCVYYQNRPYEIKTNNIDPIAAGSLSHEWSKLGKLTDAAGENICELNRYFCELTAHFSVWKNHFYNNEEKEK